MTISFGNWLSRHRILLAALALPLTILPALLSLAQPARENPRPSALNNGSPEEAVKYYKELSTKLGMLTPDTIETQATVHVLLSYLGYRELTPEDIEFEAPESLMAKYPGTTGVADILISRFFAPKIVDFSKLPAQRSIGWRRLVRIKARPSSTALAQGVESAWILFNHFTDPPVHRPFGGSKLQQVKTNSSVNTQVALVTDCAILASDATRRKQCEEKKLNSIYWMDFGESKQGYKLSYQLDAFFDAGSLAPTGDTKAPYFVPNGCDACHGSLGGNAILNTLDTDHWMDRITDGDFPALSNPNAPAPLFDAGKDTKSDQYRAAFDVLRRLNREIEAMQERTNPKSFHLMATRKWLQLHQRSVVPETTLAKRGIDFFNVGHPLKASRNPPDGVVLRWTSAPDDQKLLGLLNKYCYRCHGAIRFDVFSKDMVADLSNTILLRIKPTPAQQQILGFQMPIDRAMDPADMEQMFKLMEALYNQTH
jgi:hypothetical protein